jgi:uncharacterized damage-inducible protein DinB
MGLKGDGRMNAELQDMVALLEAVHKTIDGMVEDLTDDEWVKKPRADFNNIASVIQHTALVERRFFTLLDGRTPEAPSVNPFASESHDVPAIRRDFADTLEYGKQVLGRLDPASLSEHAVKLGVGELDRRQLIAYAIAHTTHHRGQIPLIKKLLRA